jgi:hypothetical protein
MLKVKRKHVVEIQNALAKIERFVPYTMGIKIWTIKKKRKTLAYIFHN